MLEREDLIFAWVRIAMLGDSCTPEKAYLVLCALRVMEN